LIAKLNEDINKGIAIGGLCRRDQNMRMRDKAQLAKALEELDKKQLKTFYAIVAHYWVNHKFFASTQNFFNLWCEANRLCHEVDESFPDPYEDHNLLRSFCLEKPYYFIDILGPRLSKRLFCRFLNLQLDVLATAARKLKNGDVRAVYAYVSETFGLNEDVEGHAQSTIKHVEEYSYFCL
jgi:hypothetical protein